MLFVCSVILSSTVAYELGGQWLHIIEALLGSAFDWDLEGNTEIESWK